MSDRKSANFLSDPEEFYPLHLSDEGYCGVAVIFVMGQDKSGRNTRKGAPRERDNLVAFAEKLSLKPCLIMDATEQEINDTLNCIANPPKIKPPDIADDIWDSRLLPTHGAIFVAVSSHGNSSSFLTADGIEFSEKCIINYFNEDNCPLLRGKPKFLFFNSCRIVENVDEKCSSVSKQMAEFSRNEILREIEPDGAGGISSRISSTNSNFYIIHSCAKGTLSFRSSDTGSVLISALPEAYEMYGRGRNIYDFFIRLRGQMLRETNQKVRYTEGLENATQCIETNETLTRKLIFPSPCSSKESLEEIMESEQSYQTNEEKTVRGCASIDSVNTTETLQLQDERNSKIKKDLHPKIKCKKARPLRRRGQRTRRNIFSFFCIISG